MRLIDADALECDTEWSEYEDDFISYSKMEIACAPTIDAVSVVRGEWIRDRYWSRGAGMGEEYGFFYKCSLCEYEVENGYTRCGFNFCPYCGADMRMKGADEQLLERTLMDMTEREGE